MESVVNHTTVGEDMTRFGVILFSSEPKSSFSLKSYSSKESILEAVAALQSPGGNTYTGKALEYSLQFFDEQHGGRAKSKVPQVLMVITDGEATDPYNLAGPSKELRDKGIDVFSIGVEGANMEQLVTMAGGEDSKVFYVKNSDALESLYKNISKELCNSTRQGKRQKCHCTSVHSSNIFSLQRGDMASM